eukprot:339566-Rhodomonas_salina.2
MQCWHNWEQCRHTGMRCHHKRAQCRHWGRGADVLGAAEAEELGVGDSEVVEEGALVARVHRRVLPAQGSERHRQRLHQAAQPRPDATAHLNRSHEQQRRISLHLDLGPELGVGLEGHVGGEHAELAGAHVLELRLPVPLLRPPLLVLRPTPVLTFSL